ncbi:MAG TPA: N-acetylneuraminate synthase family protein [Nitrosomonas sp.]|nr:N-acetylneuraminate synthase family protein [Nitrosomonas sp.]
MLIANIGNQHFGSFEKAKELITLANDSGADLIKGIAASFSECSPLDRDFYEMCSFSFEEYTELIEYARSIGNDLFFEITGHAHQSLLFHQQWQAVTERDFNRSNVFISDLDKETSIVSIGAELFPPILLKANIMHSMNRLSENPRFERIDILKRIYGRNIGYADKTIGIDACMKANDIYQSVIIEKHITLEKGVLFKGKPIEETIYSILPGEFERLSNQLMVFKEDTVLH